MRKLDATERLVGALRGFQRGGIRRPITSGMWRQVLAGSLAALVLATPAAAAVRRASFTGTVKAGDKARLTVTVAPKARCTIKVVYDTVTSRAKGLGAKTGSKITWEWRVGTNTHPGRWPVTVDCGRSGKLLLKLRVLPN